MKTNETPQTIVPVFIKPSLDTSSTEILFSRYVTELQSTFSFRSLDLSQDLELIHAWVNKTYAQRFWQLAGSVGMLENIYGTVLANPMVHSFIGLVDEKPICQIDVYAVQADELAEHIDVQGEDCGLHLLMCPPREMQKGWSYYALRVFQEFYFSFEQAKRLFAEPDRENRAANQLAMNTGFHFLKTIELSYKTANLYCIGRKDMRSF
jgi:hypothetical protein